MKTRLLIFSLMLYTTSAAIAASVLLQDIPVPKLSAIDALAIAQREIANDAKLTLITIEWCRASDFQPRVSDGTTFLPLDDQPNGYSWVVTYVTKDQTIERRKGSSRRLTVIRIKDDGTIGKLVGIRPN
jgi:hypothetical protein